MQKKIEISPEKIQENWEKYRGLTSKLSDSNRQAMDKLLDHFEDRLSICPASAKLQHHLACPGGLVQHTLNVVTNALLVAKTFFPTENIPKSSLILSAMAHDLGKLGYEDEGSDYYISQDSNWHYQQGNVYKYAEIPFMPTAHRSVYLLQKFSVELTKDEFVAVMTHDGRTLKENDPYFMKEPLLALVLQHADLLATQQEKLQASQ
jgi:hypothetical protein